MDKASFLSHLRREWANWEAALGEVPAARMAEPGVTGEWSAKDVVAHVTWYEREMVHVIRERVLAGSTLWDLGLARRNAAIYAENHDRPQAVVLAESADVHSRLVAALEELPEEHYGNPARFREMPVDWEPWRVFASNSYEHYPEHAAAIRTWLGGQAPPDAPSPGAS